MGRRALLTATSSRRSTWVRSNRERGPPCPLPVTVPTPRAALDEILVQELSQPPCLVSFSGGRDSSVLVAAALDVARRRGLPEPVSFTLRYPGAADAEESVWQ